MANKMLIDATHPEETRVVVVDGNRVEEFDYESVNKIQIAGNIYLAKITRVEPSLQAAFVEYGGNRHGFLAFSEIHPDYYQIPVADREALLEAERRAEQADEDAAETVDAEPEAERARGKKVRKRSRRRSRKRSDGETLSLVAAQDGPPEALLTAIESDPDLLVHVDPIDESRLELDLLATAEETPAATEAEPTVVDETIEDAQVIEASPPSEVDAAATDGDVETDGETDPESAEAAPDGDAVEAAPEPQADAAGDDPTDEDAPRRSGPDVIAEEAGADLRETVRGDAQGDGEADLSGDASTADVGEDGGQKTPRRSRRRPRGRAKTAAKNEDVASTEAERLDADLEEQDDAEDRDVDRDADQDLEVLGATDARDEIAPRRIRMRDYKIQEVIKKRQIMLVQVVKEERGTKGAALTTYLSLAGRYCVLMPNTARGGGISRKITNAADRKRLKAVAAELEVPEGMGLIIRTAGANRTKAEIKRDYEYLMRQWSAIRDLTLKSVAPALIYEEGSLIKRAIRDLYNKDIDAIQVEGEAGYREAKDYMKLLMPSHSKHVQPYRDPVPLFIRHQVESQMASMLQPTVQLKSGGYLVIGVTEALVAIDVNSGRSTKEGSIEETALKTNLEAADEVARQLRLRDLAGLIVIDFIDMEESRNNRAVEKRMKDRLKTDRARIQVGRISAFGLMEMSRQRLRPGLLEATTVCCPTCKGAGVIRSDESMALSILRAVEEEGVRGRSAAVKVAAPTPVANYMMNQKRARVLQIEERYELQMQIVADSSLVSPDFVLDRVKPMQREELEPRETAVQIEAGLTRLDAEDAYLEDDEAVEAPAEERRSERSAKGRAGKSRRRRAEPAEEEAAEDAVVLAEETGADAESDAGRSDDESEDAGLDGDDAGGRRRGRRGGRRRRKRASDSAADAGSDPLPVIELDDGEDTAVDPGPGAETVTARKAAAVEETFDAEASAPTAAEDTEDAQDEGEGATAASSGPELTVVGGAAATVEDETIEPAVVAADAEEDPVQADATDADVEDFVEVAQEPAEPPKAAPVGPRRTGWWAFRRGA